MPSLLCLLGLLALVPTADAAAGDDDAALLRQGALYRVQAGRFGDLVANAPAARVDNTALVLDISRPGETVQRMVVPGTGGEEVESAPFLMAEDASNSIYLVWESRRSYIRSRLNLAAFSPDSGWTESFELSGDVFSFKSTPRIAVTRDSYTLIDPDSSHEVTRARTIVHVVWWEEAGVGSRAMYSPVFLVDGVFRDPNVVFALPDLDDPADGLAPPVAQQLVRAPVVQPGRTSHAVAIGFANADTGRMLGLEVGVLPQEISYLADRAGLEILEVGLRPGGNLGQLADRAGLEILEVGLRYHTDFARYLASVAMDYVLGANPDVDIEEIGDGVRREILSVGSRLTQPGYGWTRAEPTTLLEIPAPGDEGIGPDLSPAVLHLRVTASRPAPEIGDGEPFVFLSQTGARAIVAWDEPVDGTGVLRYVESEGDGWSDVMTLIPDASLGRDEALRLLERRARNR